MKTQKNVIEDPTDPYVVFNPLEIDFKLSWDGKPFTVPANSEAVLPRFKAEHFVKKMVDYLIIHVDKKVKNLNDEKIREKHAERILIGNPNSMPAPAEPEDVREEEKQAPREKTMDELKEIADALDIEYKGNISRANLAKLIDKANGVEDEDNDA